MASGKSKKKLVIFNSLMWAAGCGFLFGIALYPVIFKGESLNLYRIIILILGVPLFWGAWHGLNQWWGK